MSQEVIKLVEQEYVKKDVPQFEIGDTVVTSANFLIDSESRLKAAIAGMGGAMNANDKRAGEQNGGHTH